MHNHNAKAIFLDKLLALPLELTFRIFSFLPGKDILALQLLSTAYRQLELVPLALTQLEGHDVEDAAHVPSLAARIATVQAHLHGRPQALFKIQVPHSTRSHHVLKGKYFAYPSEGGITIIDLTTQAVSFVRARFDKLILTSRLVAWVDGDVLKYAHLADLGRIQEHDVRGLYMKEHYPRDCCSSIAGYGSIIGMVTPKKLTLIENGQTDVVELSELDGHRQPILCMSKDTCVVIRPRQSVQDLGDGFAVAQVTLIHRGRKSEFLLTCTRPPNHFADWDVVVLPAGWEHTWHVSFGRSRRGLATTLLLYAHATHDFQECEGPNWTYVWKGYHYSHSQLGITIKAYTTTARPQRLLRRKPGMLKAHPPVNETFLVDASDLRKGEIFIYLFDLSAVTCQIEPLPFVKAEDVKTTEWDHCWTEV